jgi:predicted amino acid dehydrogenase
MAKLHINFPPTPYTNEIAMQRLIELGGPRELLKENKSRAEVIRESVVLGSRMAWGEASETSITIVYTGAIPKGVEIDLRNLRERGVITSWGKPPVIREGSDIS